jgi:hypothetical protein
MPALPPVSGVMSVHFKFTYSNDLDVLVRHFYSFTGGPLTNAQAVSYATAFAANYNANCLALAHPDVTMTECIVTDLTNASAGTGSVSVSYAGTASGTPLAAGTATLINALISRRYRGGKPRQYWPFGTSSSLNGANAWSSAFLSALASHYDPFLAANLAQTEGSTAVVAQVNVSYYKGFLPQQNPVTLRWRNINTPRATPVVDTVNSYAFNTRPASQRRRNTQKR